MTNLPTGWTQTTLGKLGRYYNGRGFKNSEWSTSGRPIIRIQNLTGSGNSFNYFDGVADERHIVRDGDLLISWAATLGSFVWRGPEAVVNQHIFKVESNIDQHFHRHLIDFALAGLAQKAHGSGIVHLTRPVFDSFPVSLPPLAEQQRLVEFLYFNLEGLQTGLKCTAAAAHRAEGLGSGLLAFARTATSPSDLFARATKDDSDLPTLGPGWRWRRLGGLADVVGGVTKDSSKNTTGFVEVPYLRVANVQRGRLDLDRVTTIRVPEKRAAALRLEPGDVLLNEGGDRDKLGRGWVWEGQIENCIHQNHVFRARIRDGQITPRLLSWWANSVGGAWCGEHGRQSVNLASISLSKIRQMPVPVPPLDQQARIELEVADQAEAGERLQASIDAAERRGLALRRSLLAAAFSGRL